MSKNKSKGLLGSSTLARRLAVTLGVILLIGNSLLLYQLYHWARADIVSNEHRRLTSLAIVFAQQIDGATHEALAEQFPAQDEVERWEELPPEGGAIQRALSKGASGLKLPAPLRTVRLRESHAARVAAHPGKQHPEALELMFTSEVAPAWRAPIAYTPDMGAALLDGNMVATDFYENEAGGWMSVYQPLLDASGEPTAVLIVDAALEPLMAELTSKFIHKLVSLLGISFGVFAGALAIAQRFGRELYDIEQAVESLSEGDISAPLESSGSGEMKQITEHLERARQNIAGRMEAMNAATEDLQKRLEQMQGRLDPQALQRQETLRGMQDTINLTVRVGVRELAGCVLTDLSYEEMSLRCPAQKDITMARGTPLAARLLLEGHSSVEVRASVLRRAEIGDDVEYTLRLESPLNKAGALPPPLADVVNTRSAARVRPSESAPVMVRLLDAEDRPLSKLTSVDDVSEFGLGVSIQQPPEVAVTWGTRVKLSVELPRMKEPLEISADIRNIDALNSGSRLGIAFDREGETFLKLKPRLKGYIRKRERELKKLLEAEDAPTQEEAA